MNKLLYITILLFAITSKEVVGDDGLENNTNEQSTTTPIINVNMKALKQQVSKEMQIIRHDIKTELKQHLSSLGIRQHLQLKSRKRSIETLNRQISQLTQSVATQANIIELALIGTNERLKRLQSSISNIQESVERSESDIKVINENLIIVQNNLNSKENEIKASNDRLENILTNINTVDSKVDGMKLNTKIVKGKTENIEEMMNSIKVQINYSLEDISTAFEGLNLKFEDIKIQSTTISNKMENMKENVNEIQSQNRNNENLFHDIMGNVTTSVKENAICMFNDVNKVRNRMNIVEDNVEILNSSLKSENSNYVTLNTVVNSYNNLEARMKLANETCFLTQNALSEVNNKVRNIETRMNSINESRNLLPQYTNLPDNPNRTGYDVPLVAAITSQDNDNPSLNNEEREESVAVSYQYSSVRVNGRPYNIRGDINEINLTEGDNIDDCDGDSFLVSNQCFRVYRDSKRSWEEAQQRCAEEGMVIAQPKDPSALRTYLISNNLVAGLAGNWFWLGARGNGTKMVWYASQQVLPVSDPSWYKDHPGNRLTPNHCLSMLVRSSVFGSGSPTSPYRASDCTWPFHTICQNE